MKSNVIDMTQATVGGCILALPLRLSLSLSLQLLFSDSRGSRGSAIEWCDTSLYMERIARVEGENEENRRVCRCTSLSDAHSIDGADVCEAEES